jgi:hypothetical protein
MSDNSFDSEALSDDSIEEEDTKSQTDKDKEKAKGNSPENKEIKNLELINSISKALNTILEKNKNLKNYKDILKKQSLMYFSANTIPNITIKDYLVRIQNYSEVERSTLILSLILIDRMCRKSGVLLTHYNIHRILFSSLLVSIKYNEDSYFDNNFYSQIAGVKPNELKLLEYTFLEYNDFNIYVKDVEYQQYEKYLNLSDFD